MYNFDRGKGDKNRRVWVFEFSWSHNKHEWVEDLADSKIYLEGSKYRGQLCVCSTYYLPFTIGFLFTSFILQSSLHFNYYWKKLLVYIWPWGRALVFYFMTDATFLSVISKNNCAMQTKWKTAFNRQLRAITKERFGF